MPIHLRSTSGTIDAAVGLLIVFQHRDHAAADGDRRAVERVDEVRPFFALVLEANAQPPGLIVGAIGGAGHLAVFARLAAAGHPGFQIELAIRGPAQIAGGRVDHAIGNSQPVENLALQAGKNIRAFRRSPRAA